jgi:beta-catenin-like protein 1
VIENLISVDPPIAEKVVESTKLLTWLLKRIKVKTFDSNRQYASEMLSILLQGSQNNKIKFKDAGGVSIVLQVLSTYKRKDPKDADEVEMMENLFDSLCSALSEKENKEVFLEDEGVELMLLMLRYCI